MLKWIIGSSVQSRLAVIVAAAALLTTGIVQLRDAPLEALPDFGLVRVEVQTEALGLSPEEVENLITNPMEQEFFNGIPWLHKIRSDSAPGLSSVEMIFEPGTDPIRARQVVQERLTMVPALPQVSKPPFVIQPTATTGRLMMIGLSSSELSLIAISELARWKMRQRLLAVPGVGNVSIWGLRDKQLQVLVDHQRMRRRGVDVDEVIRTAANAMWSSPLTYVEASTPGTGGFIDTAHQRISVNHTQPIKTAEHLGQVTVQGDHRRPRLLSEVADIVESHQPLIGDALVKGERGVMLVVERFPGASIAKTTREVERVLEAMRPGLQGIEIDTTVFRSVSFVESARENLAASLVIAAVLLLLVIGAFLYNWRTALISVAAIALSLSGAWLILSAFGMALNMMIVAGLAMAIAVIVDDGIIDVDNIKRRLQQCRAQSGAASAMDTIVAASAEMRGPMFTALVVVAVSMLPVLALGDVSGAFLRPIALAYAVAVIVSTGVALTVTPALAAALLSRKSFEGADSPLARKMERGYASILRSGIHQPAWMLAAAAVIALGGLAAVSQFGEPRLAPAFKDRDIVVRLKSAPGTSLPAMTRITAAAGEELRTIPGVRNVGGHIGRASNSDVVSGVDSADIWVSISDAADYDKTVEAIKSVMEGYPGLQAEVSPYANLRIREVLADSVDDLVVRVYGRNYEVLTAKAETVAKSIVDVRGVVSPQLKLPAVEPTVEIEVDIPKAAAKGVKPGDVRRAAATMLSGITAGNLFEEQKIFDVVVWADPEKRENLGNIKDLLIDAPKDEQVRLGDVADVRVRPNPSVIKHDAVSRYIDVVAKVQGRSISGVTTDVEARLKEISFPSEHHVEVLGDAAERQSAHRKLVGTCIAVAIAVFFLLQACFSSWRLASVYFVLLFIPLGGAALAAFLVRDAISVLSLIGAIAALTFAARGGILLINAYQRLEEDGARLGPDLVLQGAQQRFGALVLSTAAAALTLVPLLGHGVVAGLEIVTPMAAVMLGGLLGGALLNLLVVPVLYLRFARPRSESSHARLDLTPQAV
jgi:Cu/Ag efflux pump CusA